MNFLKKEIKNAWTRWKEVVYPHAIRNPTVSKARFYRYPAVASEPLEHEDNHVDYKTAYKDSYHNIRYSVEHEELKHRAFIADPLGETIELKLHSKGLLPKSENNDPKDIEIARKKYEKRFGESVDIRIH